MKRSDAYLACAFAVLSVVLFVAAHVRCKKIKNPKAQQISGKVCVFLGGIALWPALFVLAVGGPGDISPIVASSFVLVLLFLSLELKAPQGFCGTLSELQGSSELLFERGTQITTVAFALGTLLLSQKEGSLAKAVAPLVFLALFFSVIPSLAVGQTARQYMGSNPIPAAAQRLSLSLAAGLLCVSLAVCLERLRGSF
jgi:hypothetical protein